MRLSRCLLSVLFFPLLCQAGFLSSLFRHDISVITDTDVTPTGAMWRHPSPDKPVYYVAVSLGFHEFGAAVAGDKIPEKSEMHKTIAKVLAKQGYLPATNKNPPSIVLLWAWGTLYPDKIEDLSDTGISRQTNLLTMRAFLGGSKVGLKTQEDFLPQILPPGLSHSDSNAEAIADAATDDLYVAIIAAFDCQALKAHKKVMLWKTKISCPGRGLALADTLPTMLAIAGPNIGKETSKPIWIDATDKYKADIKIGDPLFEGFIDSGKLPIMTKPSDGKAKR